MTNPLESIDPHALPFTWMSEMGNLPEKPGVYFVIEGLFVSYIGQSVNIKNRRREHAVKKAIPRDKRQRVRVAWMECAPKELDHIETGLIRRYCPPLNGNQSGYGRKKRAAAKRRQARHWRKWGVRLIFETLKNGCWYDHTYLVSTKGITQSLSNLEEMAKEYSPGAEATRCRIRPYEPGKPWWESTLNEMADAAEEKKAAKKSKKGSAK